MASFNDMLQKYVDLEYNELVDRAKAVLPDVLTACKVIDTENDGLFLLTSVLLSAVGADKVLSATERQFLHDAIFLDDEGIDKLAAMYDRRMIELADDFVDAMPDGIMTKITVLMLCLLACDGTITVEENAFIRKIIERA